jgi:hypothetical protein
VHDTQLGQILNSRDNLLEKLASLPFLNVAKLHDVVEQFPAWGVLHDEHQRCGGFDDLVQLHNVRVLYDFQNVDFAADPLNIGIINHFGLLQYFASDLFPSRLMDAHFDLAKRAFANRLAEDVVANPAFSFDQRPQLHLKI